MARINERVKELYMNIKGELDKCMLDEVAGLGIILLAGVVSCGIEESKRDEFLNNMMLDIKYNAQAMDEIAKKMAKETTTRKPN